MVRVWLPHHSPYAQQHWRNIYKPEVLKLFRQLFLRAADFNWNTEQGTPWVDVLRLSIKEEFQNNKQERDPHIICSLLADGRDYLMQVDEKWAETQHKLVSHFDKTRT